MSNRPSRGTAPSRGSQNDGQDHTEAVLEQLETFYKKWILPYSKGIAAAVIVVLGVVLAVKGMEARRVEREGKAFAAMSEAEDPDAYMTVASEHPDTVAAPRAYMQAGRALFDDGKYDQAATKFSLARKAAGATELATVAALGEAYALEAAGKTDVAQSRFSDVAESATSDAIAVDAWLGAGRCAKLQGKLAEAEKLYNRAKDLVGEDRFAEQRIDTALSALKTARYAQRPAETPPAEADETAPRTSPEDGGAAEK